MNDISFSSRFSSSSKTSNKDRKTYLDGDLVQTTYDYRTLLASSHIQYINPPILQGHTIHDKTVCVNFIQYTCPVSGINQDVLRSKCVRIVALNQRNAFDNVGSQTTVIGYLFFDPSKQQMCGDSMTFEQDARQNVNIQLQLLDNVTGQWNNLIIQNTQTELVYIDTTIDYE